MDYSTEGKQMATLQSVRRSLEEWDIGERIGEKISIWGVRHSARKVGAIPIDFVSAAILYYLVHRMRTRIQNYNQTMLMSLGHRLRLIYNSLAIAEFKNTAFFEFSLLILAKLTHYFITSRLPELAIGTEAEIESDLYRSIVGLLIGYEVDSKAYELMEKKYKQKRKNSIERKDSGKMNNDLRLTFELPEKAKRTTNKLHRNGIRNLLQNNEEQKNLQTFRLEVHEALHVRKGVQRSEYKSQPKRKGGEQGRRTSDKAGWVKGKSKLLNINQVSAAFSIYMDPQKRTVGNIHLSKRRRVKEYYFGLHREEIDREQAMPLGEVSLNSNKNKDWSLIVESLRQRSDHVNTRSPSPAMKKFHLCHQSQVNIGAKFNQLRLEATDGREESGEQVDFKRIRNAEDKSIHCVSSDHSKKKDTLRKSSSTFFVRDRGEFERSCLKRKQMFQNSSIYLPRLEKQ